MQSKGLEASYPGRVFKAQSIREQRRQLGCWTYVDTTNMFVKTFADVAARELGADIVVVRLRRDSVEVARSARQLGWFDPKFHHLAWPDWHPNPAAAQSSCSKYGLVEPNDPVSLIVGHMVSCELDGQEFERQHPRVSIVHRNLSELQTFDDVDDFLLRVGTRSGLTTHALLGCRVNTRTLQKRSRDLAVEPDIRRSVLRLINRYLVAGAPVEALLPK